MTGVIVSPALMRQLSGTHFPATCTIQEHTPARDAAGQPQPQWTDLEGHVDIPCAVSDRGSDERRNLWGSYPEAQRLIALAGHYPGIVAAGHAALVDGARYDILAVVHDSQSAATYLPVRRVQ